MIQIYTGKGKGKTTAALGLAIRALGWGLKVCLIQFLKPEGAFSGELRSLEKFSKNFKIIRFKPQHPIFCRRKTADVNFKNSLKCAFQETEKIIRSKQYDLIILDEIINTVSEGFIKESQVLKIIKSTPLETELILTGRGATKKMISLADYTSDIREIKHPFRKKIIARKGIEF